MFYQHIFAHQTFVVMCKDENELTGSVPSELENLKELETMSIGELFQIRSIINAQN